MLKGNHLFAFGGSYRRDCDPIGALGAQGAGTFFKPIW
jgi:hypothetical protein